MQTILVRFEESGDVQRSYFGVQFYIEDMLGRRVDLVTDRGAARIPEIRRLRGAGGTWHAMTTAYDTRH